MSNCSHALTGNFSDSLQNCLVFKEQCTKCFVTAFDESGIYVCLKCFCGMCADHAAEHVNLFGHPLYLHLKSTKIPKVIEKEKVTKLGIGVEGGLDAQPFDIKTESTPFCLTCKSPVENPQLKGICDSIIKADDAKNKMSLVAWELEIYPCEHSLTLNPNPKPNINLQICSECNLSSNLWLCLECGNVGCGRKFYDGTGGNNHAVNHADTTKHSLAVKLGTISSQGEASVYCYTCNDDVKDENLPNHLGVFGIKVDSLQKTEKTIGELNLNANLNLTLSQKVEAGRTFVPVFGPGKTGLANLGNSCYVNSVMQVMTAIPEIHDKYAQLSAHFKACKSHPPSCFQCQIFKLFYGMNSGKFSKKLLDEEGKEYQEGIKIFEFKNLAAKGNNEFLSMKQQDAEEYFVHLLSFLQKQEKTCSLPSSSNLFSFKNCNKLKCTSCSKIKLNEVSCQEIKFQVPFQAMNNDMTDYKVSFSNLLSNFCAGEEVELNCSNCQSNRKFLKTFHFSTFPKILVLQMQRFHLENWVPVKIQADIQFDSEEVSLSALKFTKEEGENIMQEVGNNDPIAALDQNSLSMLEGMGFSKNRAARGLIENNGNVEIAMNWLLEKIDDPSLDNPIKSESSKLEQEFPPHLVEMIVSMGFSDKQAKAGLSNCNNDVERAIDYLFNHPEAGLEDNSQSQAMDIEYDEANSSGNYELFGVVVHLGKSTQVGHYIAYVKKEGKWIYFNDEKVATTDNPALGQGYLYFYRRKD